MAFKFAEGYVELSQRGLGPLGRMLDGVKSRLLGMLNPANLLATAVGAIGAGAGVGALLKLSGDAEVLAVSFEVLLGSAAKAHRLMEEINQFAAKTPYEQMEVAGVAKQLLAFGVAQEKVIPTMRQLGDIASLSGARINELAAIYGKARGMGVVQTEILDQFLERGIPIGRELAKVLGVAESEVRKLAPTGKITFAVLQQALDNLTGAGGQFAGGMERLSSTLPGIWSTLTGNIKTAMAGIGDIIVETFGLKGVIASAGDFAAMFKNDWAPVVRLALESVRDMAGVVLGAFTDLGSVSFGGILRGLVEMVAGIRNWMVANQEAIQGVLKFTTVIAGVVAGLMAAKAVIALVGATIAVLLSPIGLVAAAITGLGLLFPNVFDGILTDLSYLVSNWDLLWRLAWEHLKLGLSNTWERIKTFFVNVGEVLVWFVDNWRSIFETIWNFTKTIFVNLGQNIAAVWQAVLDFFSSGEFNVNWTPMLDGFKSTVSQLPNLTKAAVRESNEAIDGLYRQLGEREAKKNRAEAAARGEDSPGDNTPDSPGATAASGPAAGKASFGFVGLAALAEQMQRKAATSNEAAKQLAAAERAAKGIDAVAAAASGNGLKVQVVNGQPLVPDWV